MSTSAKRGNEAPRVFKLDFENKTETVAKFSRRSNANRKRKSNFAVPETAKRLFGWVRKEDSDVHKTWGKRFQDLVTTSLDVDDTEWRFNRALGIGGYGAVGLFEKTNSRGQVIDELAVKSSDRDEVMQVKGRPSMASEAACMANINENEDVGTIARLRAFKHYPSYDQWKFYLAYEPYGDLSRLRVRYKAFGQYFPELFMWQIFLQMLTPLVKFADGENNKWRITKNTQYWGFKPSYAYLLHHDLKPNNVLLGNRKADRTSYENDCLTKISDFGFAGVQVPMADDNKAKNMRNGTRGYIVPECRYPELDANDTSFYPFG
ncbi:hypothetical protein LTR66_016634, partial [Elasticomyces elasticus]